MSVRGFTLLEVLVALTIVGLGMLAVFTQAGQSTHVTVLMQERTLASWIAGNRITERAISRSWPDIGETGGELEYAGRQWRWRETVVATPSPALRRIDVAVALAARPDEVVHTTSAFLGEPPPPLLISPWVRDAVFEGDDPADGSAVQ